MVLTNGTFLNETIKSLNLDGEAKEKAISTAQSIVQKIITSYEEVVGKKHVGPGAEGVPDSFTSTSEGAIGLVYGRIQSGKTRAMILSTAMAFDNGFRIAIVITSNINDLVTQTYLDFTKDLKGVIVLTKDDELDRHVEDVKLDMEHSAGHILLVASKGNKSLENVTKFLKQIGPKTYPMVIFDDEGDQASLDTNTYKRSKTGDLTLQPSSINKLIGKMRKDLSASVYVSVTGTPQAVLLQSKDSVNRPSFIDMLGHGTDYIGGDHFFNTEEPEDNSHSLISIVPAGDQAELLNSEKPIPSGLRDAILFFLLSAASAMKNLELTEKQKEKGYNFLCHPSLKNTEQGQAEDRISSFLTEVKKVLIGLNDSSDILLAFNAQFEELKKQLLSETPTIEALKATIKDELLRKKILVINAKNEKRKGIEYGPGFNFLIGGNTLGRGIAIPNLLVTYYVRSAKTSQIDTMHQHARMFGYRTKTLPYTRLFITKTLYYRFRDIHESDKGLRAFIEKYKDSYPNTFPVEFTEGLRATRKGVLDINTTDTIWPGMQIYPNYILLPQTPKIYQNVIDAVAKHVGADSNDIKDIEKKGKSGTTISVDEAIKIISHIKTKSKNSWHDKTIASVMKKLSDRLGNEVILKFREAERKVADDGFLSTGTLSGPEQSDGRSQPKPTLWIMSVQRKSKDTETFVFPTIVVPNLLPNVFVFSKK